MLLLQFFFFLQSRHGGLKVGKILAFFFLYVVSTTVLSIYAGKQIPKISLKYPTIPQNTPHFIEHEQWFYLAFSSFVVSVVGCMRIQLSREIHLVQLKLVIMSRQCALSPVNMNTFPYLEKKKGNRAAILAFIFSLPSCLYAVHLYPEV